MENKNLQLIDLTIEEMKLKKSLKQLEEKEFIPQVTNSLLQIKKSKK